MVADCSEKTANNFYEITLPHLVYKLSEVNAQCSENHYYASALDPKAAIVRRHGMC